MRGRFCILLFCCLWATLAGAQRVEERYEALTDSLRIGADRYIPYTERGYTLLLPDSGLPVTGLLICLTDRRFSTTGQDPRALLYPHALPQGLAVVYLSTGVPVDLYLHEASLRYVDSQLYDVVRAHGLVETPLLLFGSMTAGHRAMKYLEYVAEERSTWTPDLRGAAIAESPLDWSRMWYEGRKQARDSLTPVKAFEGELIQTLFADAWGVSPLEDPERYADFSTYTYFAADSGKRDAFRGYVLRAYTHMPIDYWNTLNGNGIYDCNYPDLCGLINEQHLIGNDRAELFVAEPVDRGPSYAMKSQSDTWLEVDKAELVEWALRVLAE